MTCGRAAADAGRRLSLFERDVLPALPLVYAAALCLTGDPADAEGLVEETFARACTSFQPGGHDAIQRVWLCRVLVLVRQEQRPAEWRVIGQDIADQRLVPGEPPASAWPEPSAEAEALRGLPDADVKGALGALQEALRFTVYLAEVEGLSCAEIARVTGTTPTIVRIRLRNGRRELLHRLRHCAATRGSPTPGSA